MTISAGDLILVSVDDHICEPATMFDAHVPDRYKRHAPRVVEEPDGSQQWYYGEIRGRNLGLNAVAGKPPELFNVEPLRYDDMRPGCYDVHERVRDMSAGGQLAGLNFPNWTGFSGQVLNQGPDHDLNLVMIKAYNDWHVDEWCGAYPGRFIPCGILPLYDVAEAAREVKRLADKGCHAVTFSEIPAFLGLPSMHDANHFWDPFLAACEETGTVVCMHIGSSSKMPSTSADAPAAVGSTLTYMNAAMSLVDWLMSGIFERFPRLKIAYSEGQIGWIPYVLERADKVWEDNRGWGGVAGKVMRPPSEYYYEHVYGCFFDDPHGLKNLDAVGENNVTFETDYPHSDSTWPHTKKVAEEIMKDLTQEQVDKICRTNAIEMLRLDLPG